MLKLYNLSIHANGKKAYQKEVKKEIKNIKFSLDKTVKQKLIKKLKDSDYYNF